MAAAFHVYVEGPVDRTRDGVERLAAAISQKYGLPQADLVKRMTAGRFRVKANVDRATAQTYQRALEEVGAIVTVTDAVATGPVPTTTSDGVPRQSSSVQPPSKSERSNRYSVSPPVSSRREVFPDRAKTPSMQGAERVKQATTPPLEERAKPPSVPPSFNPPARPSSSSLPPANQPSKNYASGLAAAYSQEIPMPSDLGALSGESLSLASLDGADEGVAPPTVTFAPAPASAPVPASFGPPPAAAPVPPRPVAKAPPPGPVDLFAPPDAEEAEAKVEIATDEVSRPTKQAPPIASTPVLAPVPKQPSRPIPALGGTAAPETPRARFAAGVLLAILIGFIPAHLIASSREASAFRRIDAEVEATQASADTADTYAALDSFRSAQIGRKKSERRSIALTSMLIWAVTGAGIAYVWFRRVPWHVLAKR